MPLVHSGISGIYPNSTIKIPTSAYSISMALATKVGFWDAGPQAIGEDMHMFIKALFDTKGHVCIDCRQHRSGRLLNINLIPAAPCRDHLLTSQSMQCRWVKIFHRVWLHSLLFQRLPCPMATSSPPYVGITWCVESGHRFLFSDLFFLFLRLDTGYMANRFLRGEFGVSSSREIEHRLARVEMRQKIIDVAAEDTLAERKGSRLGSNEDTAKRYGAPVDFSRRVIVPPKWLRDNNGSPTFTSDDDDVSTPASSASSSTRGGRPTIARDSSISSHYSYSSADEELAVDPRKIPSHVSTGREISSCLATQQQHASHTYPRLSSSSASTSASISSPQTIKVFPFVVLAARMYEAHVMLAHLFILLNFLIVIPKFTTQLDAHLASQSLAWGRASIGATSGASTGFFSALTAWSVTNGILPQTISICNKFGAIGVASTIITFLFHDLYHREAGKRWAPSRTSVSFSFFTSKYSAILTPLFWFFFLGGGPQTRLQRIAPSFASALGKDTLPSSEMESGLLPRGSPGGDAQPPFDQFHLGIPPAPHSVRRIPWCFLDYAAVPGGLVFGVAPLLYAQVCHLWTDRLAYKVSAKPQTGPGK